MSEKEAKTPVSLETMLDDGHIFEAQGKKYTIVPVKIKEILELKKDNLVTDEKFQGFNFLVDKNQEALDKWLKRKLRDEKSEPMSIDKIADDGWDTEDLSKCMKKLYKISG